LLDLRNAAQNDLDARTEFRNRLRDPSVRKGYVRRVQGLQSNARAVLAALVPASPYREALAECIDVAAGSAGFDFSQDAANRTSNEHLQRLE
jgi:hypothetical protein